MRKGIRFVTLLAFSAMMVGCNTFTPNSSSFNSESSSKSEEPYVAVQSIIVEENVVLPLGEEYNLDITVLPDNATNKKVTVTAENDDIVFVHDSGKIEGNIKGTTIVHVTSVDNSTISAACEVTVTFSSVQEINFDQDEVNVKMGKTAHLTAIVEPETASKELIWSSNNEEVALVDEGVITPVSVGTSTITVTSPYTSGASATCVVHVVNDVDSNSAFKIANNDTTYYQIDSKQYVQNKDEQKVLVLPIYFSDEEYSDEELAKTKEFIEKSFFGSNDDCGWRSFTGYYEEASFGKLHYSGHVGDWYKAPYTTEKVYETDGVSQTITARALKNFKTKNKDLDLAPYDHIDDNYIDSLYIIYACDYRGWGSELWGFRSSVDNDTINLTGKKASAYSWFSKLFLEEVNDYGGVPEDGSNTRIIIHEHGHMLGLPDYYDYSGSGIDCVGSFDMQSNNVFDWNAYSKFSMGWVKPYYVDQTRMMAKGSETITIGDSATTGDCILLRNSDWNGSPFDEYIMLELFNPDAGNNYYDAHYSYYGGITECGYGVKIYHVDARMVDIIFDDERKTADIVKVSDFNSMSGWATWPCDNNAIGSDNKNYYLAYYAYYLENNYHYTLNNWEEFNNFYFLQLLQKGNEDTFTKRGYNYRHSWNQSDLWQTGDTFTIGNKAGYTNYGPSFFSKGSLLNDGTSFPYALSFDNVTKNSATITISYVA